MSRTSDISINTHETAIVSGYRDPEFVGVSEIFPIVPVSKERGTYIEYGPDASVIVEGLEQPLGKGRKSVDVSLAKGDFAAVKQGINVPEYDEERKEAADPEVLGERKATLGMKVIQASMEWAIALHLQNPANYDPGNTVHLTGSDSWFHDDSQPIEDMVALLGGLETILGKDISGLRLAVGPNIARRLRIHPKLKRRTSDGNQRPAKLGEVAEDVGCESVVQLLGMYASQFDRKDPRKVRFSHIWGNAVIGYRKLEKPTIDEPLWGCVVREKTFPEVINYRNDDIDADIHAVKDKWGLHVRAKERGALITM